MQNSRIIYVYKYFYDKYSILTITHPYFKLYPIPGQVNLRVLVPLITSLIWRAVLPMVFLVAAFENFLLQKALSI